MWVGHFAPGLIAKPFVPNVPIWVLALAGAAPDALHFILNLLQIESFNLDPALVKKGCFPYSNDYPYSHSMLGIAVAGLIYVAVYSALTERRVTVKDQAILFATVFSHFFLELPGHRSDVKITPNDDNALGAGLFDHRFTTFLVESGLVWLGFTVWNKMSPAVAKSGALKNPRLPTMLLAFLIGEQAFFCWGSAPTADSKYVHAPLFLSQILLSSYLLGKLDS